MRDIEQIKEYVKLVGQNVFSGSGLQVDAQNIEEQITKLGQSLYAYKFKWKKAGIPFERGVFLYVAGPALGLSKGRPKHITLDQWVVDFYKTNPELGVAFSEAERSLEEPPNAQAVA